jgi:hypothetical protein
MLTSLTPLNFPFTWQTGNKDCLKTGHLTSLPNPWLRLGKAASTFTAKPMKKDRGKSSAARPPTQINGAIPQQQRPPQSRITVHSRGLTLPADNKEENN